MSKAADYQRGYQAGRKKSQSDRAQLKLLQLALDDQKERIYLKCLELVLRECRGWSLDNKKINDAEGYCYLAKVFADNSISKLK